MEVLILLMLIVLTIITVTSLSGNRETLRRLTETIEELRLEIRQLKQDDRKTDADPVSQWVPQPMSTAPPPLADPPPLQVIPLDETADPDRSAEEPERPKVASPVFVPSEKPVTPVSQVMPQQEGWWSRWLKNNPDLERFIGENLINKIGIAVLVLGIAFFVKYAIDKEWINETGRVCIGLGCGVLLAGIAHYLRHSYKAFSSVLAGGSVAVLYFTIALAFHQYALISQSAAFLIMVSITAFAVVLSLAYDRLELAVIATLGGFLTPFMVSTGQGNYIVLFSYLIILNTGLLVLSYRKRWTLINLIALVFTVLIYGGWLATLNHNALTRVSYPTALGFAGVFYLQFLVMSILNQVRFRLAFRPLEFSVLLAINISFYTAGMVLLDRWYNGEFQGAFTALLGLINFVLVRWLFRQRATDRRLIYLLIGLTLSFLTLAVPVQLQGHSITIFWAVEFVLLYWLAQRSGIRLYIYTSLIMAIATVFSLFMDWANAAAVPGMGLAVIYTDLTGFITNVLVSLAFFAYYRLIRTKAGNENFIGGLTNREAGRAVLLAAVGLAYLTAVYAVNLLLRKHETYDAANIYHRLVTGLFVLTGVMLLRRKDGIKAAFARVGLFVLYALFYIASIGQIEDFTRGLLEGKYLWAHLPAHFAAGALFILLLWHTISLLRFRQELAGNRQKPVSWLFSILIVIWVSTEAKVLYLLAGGGNSLYQSIDQYSRAGLTIVWALCSFGFMWLGMRYRFKPLRVISLSLFALALLKLFLIDIRNISAGGKIAAFILLGVLLLVISFMYQKLKKIIIDDKI